MADHNEALRLTEACKHGWLENVDPDKCSLDDLLALLRQQAEQIKGLWDQHHRDSAELRALCAARDAAKEIARKQAADLDTLRAEVESLRSAVNAFCDATSWSAQSWKNQPYIKPLFDIDAARKATQ